MYAHSLNDKDKPLVLSKSEIIDRFKSSYDKYHWCDEKKRSIDYRYLEHVYQSILPVLANTLNKAHNLSRDNQYWEIIIGYWLVVYISVMYDRSQISCDSVFDIDIDRVAKYFHDFFKPPKDVNTFVSQAAESAWNESILNVFMLQPKKMEERLKSRSVAQLYKDLKFILDSFNKFLSFVFKVLLRNTISKILGIFGRAKSQKIVFCNSYFSPLQLLKIEWIARNDLAFSQFNNLSHAFFFEDSDTRPRFESTINAESIFEDKFICFLLKCASTFIPLSCLEQHKSRRVKLAKANPIPKLIFTANAHFSDDSFKIWAAEMRTQNAKLYISEHGGSFPARDYLFRFEEQISDLYIVGWPKSHVKHRKLPLSTFSNKYPLRVNKIGEWLIIITYPGNEWALRASSQPQSYRVFSVFSMLQIFMMYLKEPLKKKSIIKLANTQKPWKLLDDAYKTLVQDPALLSKEPLNKLFNRAKVIICTYPQSTFTDAILSGVPVVILYDPKISIVEDSANEIIFDMIKCKMCFYDAVEAAIHLNQIWADPLKWWNSIEVTDVRNRFAKYAMLDVPKKTELWANFFISEK